MQRVQKLIANSGLTSRRKAEELIEQGKVVVNGKTITLGDKATPEDTILVNGTPIPKIDKSYLVFYKPIGVLCTADDPKNRNTIFSLLPNISGLKYAGRLDKDTSGLLLLSTDGDFIQDITHPSKEIDKTYLVQTNKPIAANDVEKMNKPQSVNGDRIRKLVTNKINEKELSITLHSGQKHIVRRLVEKYGYRVEALHRQKIGNLHLGNLKPGQYKKMSKAKLLDEINK